MRVFKQLRTLAQDRRDARTSGVSLARLQQERLVALVVRADREVAFWRRRISEAGVDPEEIRSAADLAQLPILKRRELQEAPIGELLSDQVDRTRCVRVTTGGSSGRPLEVHRTRDDATRLNMSWLRPLLAHGLRPWHRRFEVSGVHNVPTGASGWQRLGMWRREVATVFSPPSAWVERLGQVRPDYLWGYGSAIKSLAQYVHDRAIDVPRVKGVFAVSDSTDDRGRDLVRRVFGCEIIDMYGATETGCIAWQCPVCRRYRVNADNVLVEVLRDGTPAAPGEFGSVVVTPLFSRAMPLIRYDLGDLAVVGEPTACSTGLPHLERLEGREDEALCLPSGNTLAPMFFDNVLKHFVEIRAWRAEQSRDLSVRLSVVAGSGYGEGVKSDLLRRIADNLPEALELEIEDVDEIEPDPSGKRRAVVTEAIPQKASERR